MSALSDLIDAGHFTAWPDTSNLDVALAKWDRITLVAENTAGRFRLDRRGRASAINALRRACERATGHHLVLESKSYSESYDFLHASYFRYRIERRTDAK